MPPHIFADLVPVAHLTQHAGAYETGFDDLAAIDDQLRPLCHSRLVEVVETKLGRSSHHQAQGVTIDLPPESWTAVSWKIPVLTRARRNTGGDEAIEVQ
jgi:hypothetical protein